VDWIAQLLPFQRSASVTRAPAELKYSPTAVHAVLDGHDMALMTINEAPVGLGVDSSAQPLPFQRAASVTAPRELLV
jgi:hypothetical protein